MERLVSRQLIAALALCASSLAGAAPATGPTPDQELLHNARFWEAHDRGDLAQLALKKLVAARPDLPQALMELGELDLRLNHFESASRVESELDRRFAGSAESKDFATEVRVATRDRLRYASIRRLVEVNRISEARAELARLFPQGAPGGVLGIEYYLLLSGTPDGAAAARAGLERLAREHAGDPRYQLALAQLMVRQHDTALEGVTLLDRLRRRDDVRRDDADRLLASGLLRLGAEQAPEPILNAYLVRNPQDTELVALRSRQQRLHEERALQSTATAAQALPAAQRQLAADLSSAALSAAARVDARTWLDRSRGSLAAHEQRRATAELRAALAFQRGQYESAIAIARDLDAQGEGSEADELLGSAARLDPQSSWLFETYVRRLLAHGDTTMAIGLLRGRPLTAKWTAHSRDALLAAALGQRALGEAQAGRSPAAVADLEEAVRFAPLDPWLRYRLAGYYRDGGEAARGRELMRAGVQAAPQLPEMHYAQALYLSQIDAYAESLAAVDGIDPAQRTDAMNALYDRMRVVLARAEARRLSAAGDLAGARAALLAVEPAASRSFDRAKELAYSWIELGDREHGLALMQPYLSGPTAEDPQVLLGWAQVLNSADDEARLDPLLARLRAAPALDVAGQNDLARLQRAHDLREIRALERNKEYAAAARRLDALLVSEPQDRQLRVARAELDLTADRARAARDRLAPLTAEDPDDLDARLSYVRALTDSGDIALARAQLAAVEARMTAEAGNEELQLSLARRQLALGYAAKALRTLKPLLAATQPRPDVLLLAGRAELALRHLSHARDCFDRAAALSTGSEALAARRARDEVDERLQSTVTAGLIGWHQPGDPGMSQLDLYTMPSAWSFARDDGSRVIARADVVVVDAGRFSVAPGSLPLLGTLQAAGPDAVVRETSERQTGLSLSAGYQDPTLAVDIGTTPLGFLVTNVVGGAEWTPTWHSLDLTLGVARRAVTSSELSYAGMRDPVTGTSWGGVVQTGPYAGFGIYRENFGVSGSVRFEELTGTHVPTNDRVAARWSFSRKFYATAGTRADVGVTVNYWNYQHNLQNYTFGSGGYYSPQSYVSVSVPLELEGERDGGGWRYRMRVAPSYTVSRVGDEPFYPDDPALQAAATAQPLPSGFTSPVFAGYRSNGLGFSASAAVERPLSEALVVGLLLDIDRTDYYHPTSVGVYLRHAFGGRPTSHLSLRPLIPYNH
jgi:cellulose synthase operon protein C